MWVGYLILINSGTGAALSNDFFFPLTREITDDETE